MLNTFSDILKVLLQVAQVVALIYAGYKFTRKPHDTLDEKLKALEKRVIEQDYRLEKIEDSLLHGNDKFRNIDNVLEVILRSVFAILEFEVHYCETEQKPVSKNLERAKDDLHDYLAKRQL